ncbi:MAG: hypothetical protein HQL45_04665, partial [Alphaproteobacteria bacterium]|nr:hypothetical protein [Alphaproteobacteria bacterium]
MTNTIRKAFLVFCAVLVLACSFGTGKALGQVVRPADESFSSQRILLLFSYGYGSRGVELFNEAFLAELSSSGINLSNLFFEYLDLGRNTDPAYRQQLLAYLKGKYADERIDLIITVQQPALNFLLHDARDIAPHAPVISFQAPTPSATELGGRQIISQLSRFDIKGTVERSLELFPNTKEILFVSGSSPADKRVAEEARTTSLAWKDRLAINFTTDFSLEAILKRAASLPPDTVIIFLQYNVDTEGKVLFAYELEAMLTKTANAPVFGLYDYNLRNGGIGGSVVSVAG